MFHVKPEGLVFEQGRPCGLAALTTSSARVEVGKSLDRIVDGAFASSCPGQPMKISSTISKDGGEARDSSAAVTVLTREPVSSPNDRLEQAPKRISRSTSSLPAKISQKEASVTKSIRRVFFSFSSAARLALLLRRILLCQRNHAGEPAQVHGVNGTAGDDDQGAFLFEALEEHVHRA